MTFHPRFVHGNGRGHFCELCDCAPTGGGGAAGGPDDQRRLGDCPHPNLDSSCPRCARALALLSVFCVVVALAVLSLFLVVALLCCAVMKFLLGLGWLWFGGVAQKMLRSEDAHPVVFPRFISSPPPFCQSARQLVVVGAVAFCLCYGRNLQKTLNLRISHSRVVCM